jgi:membrane-associated phospholipid phosphatase
MNSRSIRFVRPLLVLAGLLSLAPVDAGAQRADSTVNHGDRRFFRPRELTVLGVGVAASALLSTVDTKIARWDQSSGVQGSAGRRRLVSDITRVNETTLTIAGLATYGIGRLTHSSAATDVGKHTTEAIVITSLISQAIRGPLGRTRPHVTADSNQYDFHAFKGFTSFDNRAWPSLHSATAFAAGSALVGEIRERHPGAIPWAAPLIYAAASLPGLSRMYLDQHWASDVLAGDVIGAVIGSRLVHYAHSSPPGAGPRWLVEATVVPSASGGLMLGLSVSPR